MCPLMNEDSLAAIRELGRRGFTFSFQNRDGENAVMATVKDVMVAAFPRGREGYEAALKATGQKANDA